MPERLKSLAFFFPGKKDSSQRVVPMAALFIAHLEFKKVGSIRKIMVPEEQGLQFVMEIRRIDQHSGLMVAFIQPRGERSPL
jgi:hypothetical protein